jgi:DNA polymerase III alpha subunit
MYLNCHSYYSLRYGTLSPEQLAAEAHRLGVRELALTDINNTSTYYQFAVMCRKVRD